MKKTIVVIVLLLLSISLLAQLEVKEGSFKEVPSFVNINPDTNYQSDDNDLPFAVIKVRTENITDKQRRELKFSGNAGTFVVLEYKDGEVWVYLTAKYADYLKISHPDFSSIEYPLPFDLQPKKGYEMTLINKTNYNPISEQPNYNYLIIKANRPDALIYIDDALIGKQEVSKTYTLGEKHMWRIDCDYYHTESGDVEMTLGEPMIIEKTLRPAYGYINVSSKPENGAVVFIDDTNVGTTPYISDRIKSGTHKVKVVKEMFNEIEQIVTIKDEETSNVVLNLTANFVNVSVKTDSQSEIFIDNDKKGTGSWNGRLSYGTHVFEAKKISHKTTTKIVSLVLGKDEKIVIPNPIPIYGSVDVNSTPIGATIYIDDQYYGTTPRVLSDILIGTHTLRLEKDGYNPESNEITVNENQITEAYITLQVGKSITITTDRYGDKVYVDGKRVGVSPITVCLTYGKHTIVARRGHKKAKEEINVFKQSVRSEVHLIPQGKQVIRNWWNSEDHVLVSNISIFPPTLSYHVLNVSNGNLKIDNNFMDRCGFQIGYMIDYTLCNGFALELVDIGIGTTGRKFNIENNTDGPTSIVVNFSPIKLSYNYGISQKTSLFMATGPSLDYYTDESSIIHKSLIYYWDIHGGLLYEPEPNKDKTYIKFSIGADFGLNNISKSEDYGLTMNRYYIQINWCIQHLFRNLLYVLLK